MTRLGKEALFDKTFLCRDVCWQRQTMIFFAAIVLWQLFGTKESLTVMSESCCIRLESIDWSRSIYFIRWQMTVRHETISFRLVWAFGAWPDCIQSAERSKYRSPLAPAPPPPNTFQNTNRPVSSRARMCVCVLYFGAQTHTYRSA